MFHQNLGPIVQRAMLELNNFKPSVLEKYDREVLIRLYWQYHPRFKSFKILSTKNANMLDIGSGNGGLFYWKEYLLPSRADMKDTLSLTLTAAIFLCLIIRLISYFFHI